jgi:hypothetical protein
VECTATIGHKQLVSRWIDCMHSIRRLGVIVVDCGQDMLTVLARRNRWKWIVVLELGHVIVRVYRTGLERSNRIASTNPILVL